MALDLQALANEATYKPVAIASATKYGVDPAVFSSLISSESSWNPTAYNPSGATGIAQFIPSTASAMGIDPNDPYSSLDASAKYLSQLVTKYGNYQDAISAYKGGVGVPLAQTQATSVLDNVAGFFNQDYSVLGDPAKVKAASDSMTAQGATSSTIAGYGVFNGLFQAMSDYSIAALFVIIGLAVLLFSLSTLATEHNVPLPIPE